MKKIKLNTCAFVLKINEHKDFKQYMLNYIMKQPSNPLVELKDDITNTDWQHSFSNDRDYVTRFKNILNPYLLEVAEALYTKTFKITKT